MAQITLRQTAVVFSPGATIKNAPLLNEEVDNNFANLNISTISLDSNVGLLSNLTTTNKDNIVFAVNEVKSSIVDPIPLAIALG